MKETDGEGYEIQEGNVYWAPENIGETLKGVVSRVVDGDFGKQYAIKKDDGEEILTPSHKVLQSRMQKAGVGSKVKITYTGIEAPKKKGQNPTTMYDVGIKN